MTSRSLLRPLLLLTGFTLVGAGAAFLVLWFSQQNAAPPRAENPTTRVLTTKVIATDFQLSGVDDEVQVNLGQLRGKRVLLNFWAPWCPPCVKETPDLIAAMDQLKRDGQDDVVIIGVATRDSEENIRNFKKQFAMNYPIVFDRQGIVADAYWAFAMPLTVFVDVDGTIVKTFTGQITTSQVIEQFNTMARKSQ